MPTLSPVPNGVAHAGRVVHDLGLASIFGGQLFGRAALHPAVEKISDPYERGQVVNAAWRRYGTINGFGLLAVGVVHLAARLTGEASGRGTLTPSERRLTHVKDGLVAGNFVTGLATAVAGTRFARQAPDGRVPLTDGDHVSAQATDQQASTKRLLNVLGVTAIATEAALVAVTAALDTEHERRAPLRRRFRRR